MLTRWVGAALVFVMIWLAAVALQVALWSWAAGRGILGRRASTTPPLRARVGRATANSLRWLKSASGWDQTAAG